MNPEPEHNVTHIHQATDYSDLGCAVFLIVLLIMVYSCCMTKQDHNHEINKLELQLEIEKAKP